MSVYTGGGREGERVMRACINIRWGRERKKEKGKNEEYTIKFKKKKR